MDIKSYLDQLAALKPAFMARKYESLYAGHVRSLMMVFPDKADEIAVAAGYATITPNKPGNRSPMVRVQRVTSPQVKRTQKKGCETCGDNAVTITPQKPLTKAVPTTKAVQANELDEIGAMLEKAGVTQTKSRKSKYGFDALTDTEMQTKLADLQIRYNSMEAESKKLPANDPNYSSLIDNLDAIYSELSAAKREIKNRKKA